MFLQFVPASHDDFRDLLREIRAGFKQINDNGNVRTTEQLPAAAGDAHFQANPFTGNHQNHNPKRRTAVALQLEVSFTSSTSRTIDKCIENDP
jgi:ectoine hydroxylase-related dioxygenase (phytanoyl-CoA dioxygenase family)